jgi:hypothetical protein
VNLGGRDQQGLYPGKEAGAHRSATPQRYVSLLKTPKAKEILEFLDHFKF